MTSRLGLGPAAPSNDKSASDSPSNARESSVLSACNDSSASEAAAPHSPSPPPEETAVRSNSARSQQSARAPSAIIGNAVASCSSMAGRSMTNAHHAANGPSHSTSSTSPSAVPRVVSTKRQNSEESALLSDAGSSRVPS